MARVDETIIEIVLFDVLKRNPEMYALMVADKWNGTPEQA